jgi:hypothetical protein
MTTVVHNFGSIPLPSGTSLFPTTQQAPNGVTVAAGTILVQFDMSAVPTNLTLNFTVQRFDTVDQEWRDDEGSGPVAGGTYTDPRTGLVTGVHKWSTSWVGGQARVSCVTTGAMTVENVSITQS